MFSFTILTMPQPWIHSNVFPPCICNRNYPNIVSYAHVGFETHLKKWKNIRGNSNFTMTNWSWVSPSWTWTSTPSWIWNRYPSRNQSLFISWTWSCAHSWTKSPCHLVHLNLYRFLNSNLCPFLNGKLCPFLNGPLFHPELKSRARSWIHICPVLGTRTCVPPCIESHALSLIWSRASSWTQGHATSRTQTSTPSWTRRYAPS